MMAREGDTTKAQYVADVLPGGSAESGRYVIVGLKLASADGAPVVTQLAFSADQFDRFLIQLLDNAARARNDRLKSNPRPEDAVLNIEAAALPVVSSSAEPSVVKEGRTLLCLKMDPGRGRRRLASLQFSFDAAGLEQLSETVRDALSTFREQARGQRLCKMN
jgi:hypothetical protein